MLEPYRTKQVRKVANSLGYDFTPGDERGLIELVKDCSIRISPNQIDRKCISNIMVVRDLWEGRSTYAFDYLTASEEYPLKTMLMIRSTDFEFPFTSIQSKKEPFPPRQRILKRRRKRQIVKLDVKDRRVGRNHEVYTTDELYWERIRTKVAPYLFGNPGMFLEMHNFFFFFVQTRKAIYTTRLENFIFTGLKIASKLQAVEH